MHNNINVLDKGDILKDIKMINFLADYTMTDYMRAYIILS